MTSLLRRAPQLRIPKPASSQRRSERKGLSWWIANGDMFVSATFDGEHLANIRIEFHKHTARIPSLKNSKLPGRNFINPDTLDRLRAMDALFVRSTNVYKRQSLTFGGQEVCGILICNKRPTRFDLDNCVASVKDWCEPPCKRGRGWGVGLVDDDSRLNIFAVHAEQLGRTLDHSVLILQPWSNIRDHFAAFLSKAF